MEEWRAIRGYEKYEVSNLGNVRSIPIKGRRGKQVKLLKKVLDSYGYEVVTLYGEKQKVCKVHRLVAEAFLGDPGDGQQTNHKNGRKTDNEVENLEWCSAKENSVHKQECGLGANVKGELNPSAKLKAAQVRKILKMRSEGKTHKEISKAFKVSRELVGRICRGSLWSHETGIEK